MNIGIVGLGLMGGSLAKALRRAGICELLVGFDANPGVLERAQAEAVIDGVLDGQKLDVVFIALRPQDAVQYVAQHASVLSSTLVVDLCGVKRVVVQSLVPLAKKHGFSYIGAHPMTGRERGGYEFSETTLYENSSMIICPTETSSQQDEALLGEVCKSIGITEMPRVSPELHDEIIAYTSQLAHVVSNAFVKSPTALLHDGFSAGSFLDLTRVARLDAAMWTELFIDNADNLLAEIKTIQSSLSEYQTALAAGNSEELQALLTAGSERKVSLDENTGERESL